MNILEKCCFLISVKYLVYYKGNLLQFFIIGRLHFVTTRIIKFWNIILNKVTELHTTNSPEKIHKSYEYCIVIKTQFSYSLYMIASVKEVIILISEAQLSQVVHML